MNHFSAENRPAWFYKNEVGVSQNIDEDLRLIRAAAEQGMSDAQKTLIQIMSGAIITPSFISY